jgi:hypothetical protein
VLGSRRRGALASLVFILSPALAVGLVTAERGERSSAPRAAHVALPLAFEQNRGQARHGIEYVARGSGYTIGLERGVARIALPHAQVAVRVVGARGTEAQPARQLPGVANYLVGNRSQWHTGVRTFADIRYADVIPGVDLSYHGRGRHLEYDFTVSPGADTSALRLAFDGASSVQIGRTGDLVLRIGAATLQQPRPDAWQTINGERRSVDVRYRQLSHSRVGFEVGRFDHTRPLLIDPVLTYSTYLGGFGDDDPEGIAVDAGGSAYVVGTTASADFPVAGGVKRTLADGDHDAFVTKLNANGSAVVYSTYLGGAFSWEAAHDVAVDAGGNAYVTGETMSPDFPTVNAYDSSMGGTGDAFVAKLSPSGSSLVYSTFLGGATDVNPDLFAASDYGYGIAVDAAGAAYVTGQTRATDFPTMNALQPTGGSNGATIFDAFVTKLAPSGSALAYSTYLGGTDSDEGRGIAVDASGRAVVAGSTSSTDFPTAAPLQGPGNTDAFVAKLTADGRSFVYSTYLGGFAGEDHADAVAVDTGGNAYVAGWTNANDFPTTAGAYASSCAGGVEYCGYQREDAFLTKVADDGSALGYSTYFGAPGRETTTGVAVNGLGQATIIGTTQALPRDGFPVVEAFQPNYGGGVEGYVTQFSADGSSLLSSSYLGGNWHDIPTDVAAGPGDDETYVTGSTNSTNFTTTAGAYDRTGGETCPDTGKCDDAFVVKIGSSQQTVDTTPPTVAVTAPADGSVVRGDTLITADASDDTSVRQVEFLVNGQTVGYDPYAPHEALWYTGNTPEGPATITVQASDPAGNIGTSPAVHVIVDNAPPETSITDSPSGTVNATSATVAFASSETSSSFTCSLDGAKASACASPVQLSGLSGGPHTFAVRGTDAAGTADASPAVASWTVFNDKFAAALPLRGASGTVSGSTDGATVEQGEPRHAGSRGGASVWFSWTAPATGTAVFDTAGSSFDTILAVYTGSAVTKLTEVASNNNYRGTTARVSLAAVAGTTYRIALDGKNGRTGSYTLAWNQAK